MAEAASSSLSISDIQNELSYVTEWYPLGIQLKVPPAKLKEIETNYRGDIERCIKLEAIGFWLDNTGDPSWGGLAKALQKIGGHARLVQSLLQKENQSSSEEGQSPPWHCSHKANGTLDEFETVVVEQSTPWHCIHKAPFETVAAPGCKGIGLNDEQLLDLRSETYDIRAKFNVLFTQVRRLLDQKAVTVEDLVLFLEKVPAFATKCRSLFDAVLPTLHRTKNLCDVFRTIADYCSWFNHSLIGDIIAAYCPEDENIKKTHEEFCTQLRKYCKHRACKCFLKNGFGFGRKRDLAHVTLKIDSEWSIITIEQLEEVKYNLGKVLKVQPRSLYLLSAEYGCVQLTFLVPVFVAEAIFPLSPEQESALVEGDVLELHCGDYHLHKPSPQEQKGMTPVPSNQELQKGMTPVPSDQELQKGMTPVPSDQELQKGMTPVPSDRELQKGMTPVPSDQELQKGMTPVPKSDQELQKGMTPVPSDQELQKGMTPDNDDKNIAGTQVSELPNRLLSAIKHLARKAGLFSHKHYQDTKPSIKILRILKSLAVKFGRRHKQQQTSRPHEYEDVVELAHQELPREWFQSPLSRQYGVPCDPNYIELPSFDGTMSDLNQDQGYSSGTSSVFPSSLNSGPYDRMSDRYVDGNAGSGSEMAAFHAPEPVMPLFSEPSHLFSDSPPRPIGHEVLLTVVNCLMHRQNCQIPNCPCKAVQHQYRQLLSDSLNEDTLMECAGNHPSERRKLMHFSLSTSNLTSNTHPHYHLTSKPQIRRVTPKPVLKRQRSKSMDFTMEHNAPVRDEPSTFLREISILADNIPALCLNDCPITPSPTIRTKECPSSMPHPSFNKHRIMQLSESGYSTGNSRSGSESSQTRKIYRAPHRVPDSASGSRKYLVNGVEIQETLC